MNLLESKVIQTKSEKEIYIDQNTNIEISSIQYPDKTYPYYEIMVGLELIRIRANEYYGTKKAYFGIRITEDLQSMIIFGPDQQSIFASKNDEEKDAAKELINYLLIESLNFKQLVMTMIRNLKTENGIFEKEISKLKEKEAILEKLLKVTYEDVKFAIQRKIIA
ncbi:hypothetical protein KW850_28395 [Bacillus sp. sid0103]|uniref:hypothetical protein n=1 Tax=Bacillus sp. sid0103 TaxID=2856337 RepID=UPI001C45A81B|nr:hypothetical protein [Bacillus sp. sid0103]MBV7509113.1 hypothetical protein [Bacillus sp. sid0103]